MPTSVAWNASRSSVRLCGPAVPTAAARDVPDSRPPVAFRSASLAGGTYGDAWLLGTVTVTVLVVALPLPSFAS